MTADHVMDKIMLAVLRRQLLLQLDDLDRIRLETVYLRARGVIEQTRENIASLQQTAGYLFANAQNIFVQEGMEAESLIFQVMNETFIHNKYTIV
jgi:hypothetical protein